jgi:hypothetical protein
MGDPSFLAGPEVPMSAWALLPQIYRMIKLLILIFLTIFLIKHSATLLISPMFLYQDDFVAYWSAARLLLTGGNPYDPSQVLRIEREEAGVPWTEPLMFWNPPWIIFILLPFGILNYQFSRVIWFIMHIFAIATSVYGLWKIYGGSRKNILLAWLFAFFFVPTLVMIRYGQSAILVLLSLTGFIYFARYQRWSLAGVSLILATVKPHLVYLVLGWIVLYIIRNRIWSLGVTWIGPIIGITALFAWRYPALFTEFFRVHIERSPAYLATFTIGAWLRMHIDPNNNFIQFIPTLIAVLSFLLAEAIFKTKRNPYYHIQRLTLISLLTTPFGWLHDQVISLIIIIPAFLRSFNLITNVLLITAYFLMNILMIFAVEQTRYAWIIAILILLYLISKIK